MRLRTISLTIAIGNTETVDLDRYAIISITSGQLKWRSGSDDALLPARLSLHGPKDAGSQPSPIGPTRLFNSGASAAVVEIITSEGRVIDSRDSGDFGATVPVTGPLTDAQLRALAVAVIAQGAAAAGTAVSGNPVLLAGSDGTNVRTLSTDGGGRLIAIGPASHGQAIASNPVRMGSRARSTNYTAVANDQNADLQSDLQGRQVIQLGGIPQVQGLHRIVVSTTTETTLIAAVATTRYGIFMLSIANRDTVAATVDFRDTTGGTIRMSVVIPAGATWTNNSQQGIWQSAVNTNWTAQLRAATTANAVEISAQSFNVGY